jgi:ribonuclease VapC
MIAVDASAVLAILLDEPERARFTTAINDSAKPLLSPVGYWEIVTRAQARGGEPSRSMAKALVDALGLEIIAIDAAQAELAINAMARFGRRTPAKLNLGDCFAYALAKAMNAPLLFNGDDFRHTDIVAA